MVVIKIYLDDTKYFEIGDEEYINIKSELPLPKSYQIYQFRIFHKSERGYKPIDTKTYFIYKDSDDGRHLYSKSSKLRKISDITLSTSQTIKIFMRHTYDYYIYDITLYKDCEYQTKYLLSENLLTKDEIVRKIFHGHVVDINITNKEEIKYIINMEIDINMMDKKNWIYYLKKYIHKIKLGVYH